MDRPPMHDISLRIRGPAVEGVLRLFDELWATTGGSPPPRPRPVARAGPHTIAFARTVPPGILGERDEGILGSYLDAIGSARSFVYLENQYLTSERMVEAVLDAVDRTPRLQVIWVLNEHMDVPGYDRWQEIRVRQLDHPRIGIFTLATPPVFEGGLRPIYVHSKLGIVDDEWLTVGSANLDTISLETAREFGIPVEPNIDFNAIILDGAKGAPRTGFVARERRRLWAEHLADRGAWTATPPPGGWLALWRAHAAENLALVQEGAKPQSRVLPYILGRKLAEAS
jgi:phosphatidylserine/phosphatidylglycerophosphate/cardiolipin synthase-like enzyme